MSDSLALSDIEGGSKAWGGEGFGVGDKISGTITSVSRKQQTSFQDNSPEFWDNGDPKMLTVVEIQTDLSEDDNDDGVRALWLKGGKNYEPAEGSGQSGEVALAKAVRDAKSDKIEVGAKLDAAITGMAKKTSRGTQPAKLWTMRYRPPVESVAASELFDDDDD